MAALVLILLLVALVLLLERTHRRTAGRPSVPLGVAADSVAWDADRDLRHDLDFRHQTRQSLRRAQYRRAA